MRLLRYEKDRKEKRKGTLQNQWNQWNDQWNQNNSDFLFQTYIETNIGRTHKMLNNNNMFYNRKKNDSRAA